MKTQMSSVLVLLIALMLASSSCSNESYDGGLDGSHQVSPEGGLLLPVGDSAGTIYGPGSQTTITFDSAYVDWREPTMGPEAVVTQLAAAYEQRDLVGFEALLTDDFKFYPACGGTRFPDSDEMWWDKDIELEIHRSLFDEDYVSRGGWPSIERITCRIACLEKRPYSQREPQSWQLSCNGLWILWNRGNGIRPFAIAQSSRFSLVLVQDAENEGGWLIQAWQDELGRSRLLYKD